MNEPHDRAGRGARTGNVGGTSGISVPDDGVPSDSAELITAAQTWRAAGFGPFPAIPDEKRPRGGWKDHQTRPAPLETVAPALMNGDWLGLVLLPEQEVADIEGRAVEAGMLEQLREAAEAAGIAELLHKVTAGYCEATPSGGFHIVWRCDAAEGNQKLASRPGPDGKPEVLIETRGPGGFVVVAPSPGYQIASGAPDSIVTITAEEREDLLALVRSVDQMPAKPAKPSRSTSEATGDRPGDQFNERATWPDVLEPHGWVHVGTGSRGEGLWRRPGKMSGWSATTNATGGDTLIVHSTSTEFDVAPASYSKFAAYALLNHGGDHKAAAERLAADGYGGDPLRVLRGLGGWVAQVDDATSDEFWSARPALARLHAFARARRVSPWALLGVELVRVAAAVPPFVMLPALVGGRASLNTFVGLVGRSGAGKDAAIAAAGDALDVGELVTVGVGSGEGIVHQYVSHKRPNTKTGEPGGLEQHTTSVIFEAAEVETLAALKGRQASTLLPELRKAWTGAALGFAYVDREKRLKLRAHKYRLGLIVGIQPAKASALLDDADAGTPQRFLWLPATDPDTPDQRPAQPEALTWRPSAWPTADQYGRVVLDVCSMARDTIERVTLDRARGNGDPLDGHALLARLKVAALLDLLDGDHEVTEDGWALARHVMAVSDATRAGVVRVLDQARQHANQARGRADAEREEAHGDETVKRVARLVWRKLPGDGSWVSRSPLRRGITTRDRGFLDAAIDGLAEAGQVEIEDTGRATRYRRLNGGGS